MVAAAVFAWCAVAAALAGILALRRRSAQRNLRLRPQAAPSPVISSVVASSVVAPPRPVRAVVRAAGPALGVDEVTRVCPSCHAEHRGLTFCPRDARRLIAPEEMLLLAPSPGAVCPACHRAQEPGQRRCPHDGASWVPRTALVDWPLNSTSRRAPSEPTGVIGKICLQCNGRFDLAARFCGHDGSDLVVIN